MTVLRGSCLCAGIRFEISYQLGIMLRSCRFDGAAPSKAGAP
jgi:hypothetical protein